MKSFSVINFWKFDKEYWYQKLQSSENGLNQSEVDKVHKLSPELRGNKSQLRKDLILFFKQYKSPLMLLLIGAVFLSAFLGDPTDGTIILLIVLSSGTLSFIQERKAGRVVEKLQSMIALKSMVIRDGRPREIFSNLIAPGDVLLFQAGDMIPADCLILESNELHANEASLTGESFPVRKKTGVLEENTELAKRTNCLWEGSSIISGSGKALVIAIDEDTIFGNIAESASVSTETEFEKNINDFGFFLMRITLVLSLFILIVNLLLHKGVIESALFALALAVGMAPELLPAITTIAMSAGADRLLKKKVIVKKLSSIQNLGEVNLLCTDKTGTITEGTISVSIVVDSLGVESEYVKKLAFWNAQFETGYVNPIDVALRKIKIESAPLPEKLGEIPYDFIRKRLSILVNTGVNTGKENLLITKGAFKEIISTCSKVRLSDSSIQPVELYRKFLEQQFLKYGENGFRTLAVCEKIVTTNNISKEQETQMVFAGFILLNDPVKPGITEAINELKKLEVQLKIITGDNQNIARSIAKNIGINAPNILIGRDLLSMSTEALVMRARETHIFAEIEPQQKEQIIQALRKSYTVAYLGDGINDVSAINAADVGISVENAVDIARSAADIVLLEKNLMVLVEGMKEGRKTFANTLKYILINTGSTFGNMFSVAAASLILTFLPMLPKQILLTNFITDFPYLSIASDNVDEEQIVMPGKWDLKLIRNYMIIFGIHSSLFDLITFLVLLYIFKAPETRFQTAWFVESVLTELFILFIIRTRKNFFKSKPGKYLILLSLAGTILTLSLPYLPWARELGLVPLPMINIAVMLTIVTLYILSADILKVWFFKNKFFRT
ncbi:MAG: magnesium-translocating P-type ATPase [Bacteriovorax sp.]|nr:magnesium-translocating P-type ATPase [Bacteriovorax sp.]